MSYFIFEPSDSYAHFYPLSLNKSVYDLILGFQTLKERLEFFLKEKVTGITSRNFLGEKFYSLEEKITGYVFNSSFVVAPNIKKSLSPEILMIDDSGNHCCFYVQDFKIQDLFNRELLTQHLKNKKKVYVQEISLGYLKHMGDLIQYQSFILKNDLENLMNYKEELNFFFPKDYSSKIQIEKGKEEDLFIHENAFVSPYSVFNTEKGPIFIEEKASIHAFSYIEGPCFIGKNVTINQAMIRSGCYIGEGCKIGGEIEESIFLPYSNKNHEGFVGHSYVGCFTNFGALTTTSDLKNNYHPIRLEFQNHSIQTDSIKLGAFIGDYTKFGIGSLLNTGTCIGIGCNLFNENKGMLKKNIDNFTWGNPENKERYRFNQFMDDTQNIVKRRNKVISKKEEDILRKIYDEKTIH